MCLAYIEVISIQQCAFPAEPVDWLSHQSPEMNGAVQVIIVCPVHVHGIGQNIKSLNVRTWFSVCVCVCVFVCNALIASKSVQSMISIAPSIFNRSSPDLDHRLPNKYCINCTISSQNGFIQCACAVADFRSNGILSFVNANGRNFSPIGDFLQIWYTDG